MVIEFAKKFVKKVGILLLILVMQFIFVPVEKVLAATTAVNLLTTDNFAVLAGSSVNDTNISVVVGDIGLSPSTWSSALTCAEVTGTIYSVDGSGPLCRVTNPGLLTQAKNDLTTAYTDTANRTPATTLPGGDNQLGGQVLTDGVYTFGGASSANLTGTLTLDAQGDPNAVFIFQASSTLTTASSSVVALTNGAQACNVFWQVSTSATFGTGSNFVGTVMADQSITDNGGSTINGRFLARIAAVTLNNTNITKPSCATTSSSSSATASSASGGSSSSCPNLNSSVVTPNIISSRRIDSDSIFISWGPYSGTDTFNVRYGPTNGNWLYNTNVTGFSTTINNLPTNSPIWVQVAARNSCTIDDYGLATLVGGTSSNNTLIPGFPNTGIGSGAQDVPWRVLGGVLLSLVTLYLIQNFHRKNENY